MSEMMRRTAIAITAFCFFAVSLFAQQTATQLRFNEDGYFKIAQFTDLHWSNNSRNTGRTADVIKSVLIAEKPDLAVITGDIVTNAPGQEGWLVVAKIFEEMRTPWAVTFGNHDEEAGMSLLEIMTLLEPLPYFVGERGLEDVAGIGNHTLTIRAHNDAEDAAVLYFFDTHNKPSANRYGHYNWIQFNQIDWYRNTSRQFATNNNNVPLPALVFLHIPIMEYKNVQERGVVIGNIGERVHSAEINSGMFASMIEKKDVMGVFAGHDHSNDYIGLEHGIALAFGRITGVDAYGSLERGGRIIKMYEGKQQFDTWIRTPKGIEFEYFFPSGMTTEEEETMEFLPALNIDPSTLRQGVAYKYYEADFRLSHTSMIPKARLVREGVQSNFSIASAEVPDSMAFDFRTYIKIPESAVYQFYTFSDDGSVLLINGQMVVDNDGSHSLRRVDGRIALEAGFHELRVLYFENYMGEYLEVGISSRNMREGTIPDHMLFTPK